MLSNDGDSINNILCDKENNHNQIDINAQALQTLTDAALNVKNLLSDFLINADPDDKQIFHIEDELKRIKNNNNFNEPLNIFNLMGGNNSDNSNHNEINNNYEEEPIFIKKFKSYKKKKK